MGINIGQLSVLSSLISTGMGLQDLIVGERTGNINYFQNTGTAQPYVQPQSG